jgi:hypothetical protein
VGHPPGIVLVVLFYVGWKMTPKPKEAPTLDQQFAVFAEKFPWLAHPPEKPAPVPIQHTSVSWLWAKDAQPRILPMPSGAKPRIDVGIKNAGDYKILKSEIHGKVVIVPLNNDQSKIFKQQIAELGGWPTLCGTV